MCRPGVRRSSAAAVAQSAGVPCRRSFTRSSFVRSWRSAARPAGITPPTPGRRCGLLLVEDLLDVALGDLQALVVEVAGDLAHGQVLELFGIQPVQVRLDALTLGHPSR